MPSWLKRPGLTSARDIHICFLFGFRARQDNFTDFAQSGTKPGDPREKPTNHSQAELCSSHMWPELGSNPQRCDERLRELKFSNLNQPDMEATGLPNVFFVQVQETTFLFYLYRNLYRGRKWYGCICQPNKQDFTGQTFCRQHFYISYTSTSGWQLRF